MSYNYCLASWRAPSTRRGVGLYNPTKYVARIYKADASGAESFVCETGKCNSRDSARAAAMRKIDALEAAEIRSASAESATPELTSKPAADDRYSAYDAALARDSAIAAEREPAASDMVTIPRATLAKLQQDAAKAFELVDGRLEGVSARRAADLIGHVAASLNASLIAERN